MSKAMALQKPEILEPQGFPGSSKKHYRGSRLSRFTSEKKTRFLKELASTGNVTEACRRSITTRPTVYEHRKLDKGFAARWDEAEAVAVDALESEARRRAVEGIAEPVFHQGMIVGTIQRYSDTLLIFLMKGHNPGRYRERWDGGSLNLQHNEVHIYLPSNGR